MTFEVKDKWVQTGVLKGSFNGKSLFYVRRTAESKGLGHMFHFFIRYLFLELMSCALKALTVIQSSVVGQPFSAC